MKSDLSTLKVAIVTGAGQGIGRAIARRLARDGFAVAIIDINADALEEVKREIKDLGAPTLPMRADLSQLEDVQKIIVRSVEWGQLTALINNAGRVSTRPYLDVTEEDWDAIMTLDLKTVFFAMQFAARHMPAGSRIVNISSISGRSGRADQAPYAAAKSGVISLTQSAALAFASRGITVNAVCPGVVDTPLTRRIHENRAEVLSITPEESLARMVARIPLGRLESVDDVAGAVSFLCSPDAAYITGQSLNVCGGMEMD
ncbi:MAG TPA: SDR family NAD(P)-dependent oxidoreductase [Anaerolineales bacterium]|nr:SDR family NAD(P)-dependent oxidoreductase [Anaerolineales bacterium]